MQCLASRERDKRTFKSCVKMDAWERQFDQKGFKSYTYTASCILKNYGTKTKLWINFNMQTF